MGQLASRLVVLTYTKIYWPCLAQLVIVTGFTSIRVKSLTFNNVLTSDLIKGLFDFALKHGYTTIEYERKRGDSFVYRKIDLTKHNNKPC